MQINTKKQGGYENRTCSSTEREVLSLYGPFHSRASAGGDFFSSISTNGMRQDLGLLTRVLSYLKHFPAALSSTQSDLERRRLKEDLERNQERIRDLIQENSHKLNQEKVQVEKKYRQEIDHLNNEMSQEYETLTKAKLDLERQKRVEAELRRELSLKANLLEDVRTEMQTKISKV